MDYAKLYDRFIQYCKTTPIKERIKKRDKNDFRLKIPDEKIYTEIHHIIPRSQGGDNSPENLVQLLIEEHVFAHKLRFKAFGNKSDYFAVKRTLTGFNKKTNKTIHKINKIIKRNLIWSKKQIKKIKEKQWHTDAGLKKISQSAKGKVVVRCIYNPNEIRKVSTDNILYQLGIYVHHTKGRKFSKEEKEKRRLNNSYKKGAENGNYKKNITKEFLFEFLYKNYKNLIDSNNHIRKKEFEKLFINYCKNFLNIKKISLRIIDQRFGSFEDYINQFNLKYNLNVKYYPWYRDSIQIKKISESLKRRNNVNN